MHTKCKFTLVTNDHDHLLLKYLVDWKMSGSPHPCCVIIHRSGDIHTNTATPMDGRPPVDLGSRGRPWLQFRFFIYYVQRSQVCAPFLFCVYHILVRGHAHQGYVYTSDHLLLKSLLAWEMSGSPHPCCVTIHQSGDIHTKGMFTLVTIDHDHLLLKSLIGWEMSGRPHHFWCYHTPTWGHAH